MKELRDQVAEDQRRITRGERPVNHVTWTTSLDDGAVDLRIRELPIIHLFVLDESGVLQGRPQPDCEDPWGRTVHIRGRAGAVIPGDARTTVA